MKKIYILFACIAFLPLHAHSTIMKIPVGFGVDFCTSMAYVKDIEFLIKNDSEWKKFKSLYDQHVINNLQYKEKRIPKIIHQIWLGSPLPKKYKKFQKTWIKHNPDWEYKLWTDKEIAELNLTNKQMYEAESNYGAKSDIARYEILYRFGGLYVDTDFECLKPFEIFNHCFDFYVGIYFTRYKINNAIIGSISHHPILKECIETLNTERKLYDTSDHNIIHNTGPIHLYKAFIKHCQNCSDSCVAFPSGYFYPWPFTFLKENKKNQRNKWIRPESFAIHHWHLSWSEEKSENIPCHPELISPIECKKNSARKRAASQSNK